MKWSLDLKEDSMNPFYVKELLAKEAIIKARLYSVDPGLSSFALAYFSSCFKSLAALLKSELVFLLPGSNL